MRHYSFHNAHLINHILKTRPKSHAGHDGHHWSALGEYLKKNERTEPSLYDFARNQTINKREINRFIVLTQAVRLVSRI